jgi:hypothetical protein
MTMVMIPAETLQMMEQETKDRLADARKGREWRPIETAPRDGTTIIICTNSAEEPDPCMAHFRDGKWVCTTKEDWDAGDREFRKYAWWSPDATHWMPRPAPPPRDLQ